MRLTLRTLKTLRTKALITAWKPFCSSRKPDLPEPQGCPRWELAAHHDDTPKLEARFRVAEVEDFMIRGVHGLIGLGFRASQGS